MKTFLLDRSGRVLQYRCRKFTQVQVNFSFSGVGQLRGDLVFHSVTDFRDLTTCLVYTHLKKEQNPCQITLLCKPVGVLSTPTTTSLLYRTLLHFYTSPPRNDLLEYVSLPTVLLLGLKRRRTTLVLPLKCRVVKLPHRNHDQTLRPLKIESLFGCSNSSILYFWVFDLWCRTLDH